MLREEWKRREELERLQAEQRKMLDEETKKRQAFELQQEEKDEQLRGKILLLNPFSAQRHTQYFILPYAKRFHLALGHP